jgi:hypothetical protein
VFSQQQAKPEKCYLNGVSTIIAHDITPLIGEKRWLCILAGEP